MMQSGAAGPADGLVTFGDSSGAGWARCGDLEFRHVFFGVHEERARRPVIVIVRAGRDVGDRVAGTRRHPTPTMTVVLDGVIELDGVWMGKGDLQVVPADRPHGDLVVGPDGAVFGIVFGARSGMVPAFVDPDDQQAFDTELRAAVEEVASGSDERSVPLLPARSTFTPRRGVKVVDPLEVAALRSAR